MRKCSLLGLATSQLFLTANAANSNTITDNGKNVNKRPNIVWFLAEDLSPHYLALFNDGKGARTPNLERLAQEGVIYTNAYSNAPVSSAARTTLITGCYAPRFAGSFHRKIKEKPMPKGLRMFPTYLRRSGYYTCNASKTDYNVVFDKDAWDKPKGDLTTWRNRLNEDQPFFYQRNNVLSHESCLHFGQQALENKKTVNNTTDVYIHPQLPDTKLMRYTYATFYDHIQSVVLTKNWDSLSICYVKMECWIILLYSFLVTTVDRYLVQKDIRKISVFMYRWWFTYRRNGEIK